MSGSRAAARYAKAILSFAMEQNKEVEVHDDMQTISNTIKESTDLQQLIGSPVLKRSIKKTALNSVFSGKISSISTGAIGLLVDNKRIALLPDVAQKYIALYDSIKGIEVANVTTAIPLTDELKKEVLNKVKEITGKEATLENSVDASILGGFILRIGDVQYDASIANKLQVLKRQFEDETETYVSKL